MKSFAHGGLALMLGSLIAACGAPATPPQSPTNDAQPPATTTGDGEVIGADRVSPAQKLDQGPKLDSRDGIEPAKTPTKE